MTATAVPKPIATATIEPIGARAPAPREHRISVVLKLSSSSLQQADKQYVAGVVRRSLAAFPVADGDGGRRGLSELSVTTRSGRNGNPNTRVVGVEGTAVCAGRPETEAVETLREALRHEGYRVEIRERRDCSEPHCPTQAMVDWDRSLDVPSGWYSGSICGRHNYRRCAKCSSVYLMTSTNSVGPAPSVHCQVCGRVLVEWGGSKIWIAELQTRGPAAA